MAPSTPTFAGLVSPRKGAHKDRGFFNNRRHRRTPAATLLPLLTAFGVAATLMLVFRGASLPGADSRDDLTELNDNGNNPSAEADPAFTGNIALSYAHKTPLHRLAIFVLSWAEHSPGTRLIIFTDAELLDNRRVLDLYEQAGVEAVRFEAPSEVDDPGDAKEPRKPGRVPLAAMQHYLLYMEQKAHDAKMVAVLGPVGDIALQGDPFAEQAVQSAVAAGRVLLTEEGGSQLGRVHIRHHQPTIHSANECYGKEGVDALGKRRLLNPNVAFGPRLEALRYVRLMGDILETRVRFRCLQNARADAIALAHAVYEVASDKMALDFKFLVAVPEDSPVFGVALGLPALLDGRGRLRRDVPGAADPAVITDYAAHPMLLKSLMARFRPVALDLQFVQSSGYKGKGMGRSANAKEKAAAHGGEEDDEGGVDRDAADDSEGDGNDALPVSWEDEAREEQAEARRQGRREDLDRLVDGMVLAGAGGRQRGQQVQRQRPQTQRSRPRVIDYDNDDDGLEEYDAGEELREDADEDGINEEDKDDAEWAAADDRNNRRGRQQTHRTQ